MTCHNLRMQRSAHPYKDLDVLDSRAPRFNQAVIGSLSLTAFLIDAPLIVVLLAAQLVIGLTVGRRFCLPCLAYFELIQPRFGEGPLEDSRPPRFANMVGAVFLTAASIFLYLGVATLGWVLTLIVAALALLAASTGFCLGCTLYRLSARLKGVGHVHHEKIDLADLGEEVSGATVVEFTHPLCADCQEWEMKLREEGEPLVTINVKERPELAHKYGIVVVPTVVRVDSSGTVLERLAP